MSRSVEELRDLLDKAEALPYGPGQIAAIEQVLRHVDAAGDRELAFDTRMAATNAYVFGGEPVKSFVTFSWCLNDFDRNPASYHSYWKHSLLWHFKYMVSGMLKFPEVPLARTVAVLDEMERRYRAVGEQLQPVYSYRYFVADHIGDTDAAARWYERWVTAPRSNLSDCAGCDPSSQMYHLVAMGRDAEAVALGEGALAKPLGCVEQPQGVLSGLMVPYVRLGRPEDAADAQRRSYRVFRRNIADFGDIAEHVEFCARTGNEHLGLEIFQRHLDWLPKSPSPARAMDFCASGGLLLRRLTELGHGDAPVRHGERTVAVRELAGEMAAEAHRIATRFDARNGTGARTDAVTRTLSAEPYGVTVPLNAR